MTDSVVVVTGASGGVGRAVVRELARPGVAIALLARGESGLEAAAAEARGLGATALPLAVDVAVADEVFAAAARAEAELGPIEAWVNVAFSSVFAPFQQITAAEFERTTAVTYLGDDYGTMAALRTMVPRDRGTIVQVGSALAYRGIPLQSAYCGSKHAIQGFNESLRCELLHDGSNVHVTMVQLPAVNTPQFSWVLARLRKHPQPVPPIFAPEVAARAVAYALRHPRRRERWVGSSTVLTIMANAVAPGVLDRYLARTGYSAQQTDVPDPGRSSNLWSPADGATGADYGAHGVFADREHQHSVQQALAQHPVLAAAGGVTLAAALAAGVRRI